MRKHPGETQFIRKPMFIVFKKCGIARALIFNQEGKQEKKMVLKPPVSNHAHEPYGQSPRCR